MSTYDHVHDGCCGGHAHPAAPDAPTTYSLLWTTRVRVKESDLSHGFEVLVFLGSVPEDSKEWSRATSYVGSVSAPGDSNGQADTVTEGYAYLNPALAKNDVGRTEDDARPYIKDNLNWRVQLADGTPVPVEKLPSLEVMVVAIQIALRDGELPSQAGEPVPHPDITSGRVGGARLE